MICRKCGLQNAEGSAFCARCGERLGPAPAAGAYQHQPAYQPQAPMQNRRILSGVRGAATSPVYLVCAIAFSVYVLMNLLANLFGAAGPMLMLSSTFSQMGIDTSALNAVSRGSAIGVIIGSIPSMVIVAGLWLLFASASDRSTPMVKTTGLTMIKVVVIIQIVLLSISLLLVEIGLIAANRMASRNPYADLGGIFVIAMIVVLILFGLGIFYEVQIVRGINGLKSSMTAGRPGRKMSMFVAVMNFISGVCSALGVLLSGIVTRGIMNALSAYTGQFGYYPRTSFWNVIAQLSLATAMFSFGLLIVKYRDSAVAVSYGNTIHPMYDEEVVDSGPLPNFRNQSVRQENHMQYAPPGPGVPRPSVEVNHTPQPPVQQWVAPPQPPLETGTLNVNPSQPPVQDYPETNVLDQPDLWTGTTVLNGNTGPTLPWLERVKTRERIFITRSPFRVGKAPAGVEYTVADNPAVSRVHAELTLEGGSCYILDNNSTNYVFVNDYQIPAKTKIKLEDQMQVRLGNEAFVFHAR